MASQACPRMQKSMMPCPPGVTARFMACECNLAALTLLGVVVARRVVPYTRHGVTPIFIEGPIAGALSPGVGTLHHVDQQHNLPGGRN
jgi:hypothetical protein